MELEKYQNKMLTVIKNYLDLSIYKKKEPSNADIDSQMFNLLVDLVSINEQQKEVIARLRREKNVEDDRNDIEKTEQTASAQAEVVSQVDDVVLDTESREPSDIIPEPVSNAYHCPSPMHNDVTSRGPSPTNLTTESLVEGPTSTVADSPAAEIVDESPDLEDSIDSGEDIHELVTHEEFMRTIGLLTVLECDDVVFKRGERHKKTKYSHIFNTAMWVKQETKRKRRDWLVSAGSPPQLRRKNRPPSQPPSRHASRPTSPAEGGSSSSSNTPPNPPSSPRSLNPSPTNEEICLMCKLKGAAIQCDGCGVFFHAVCVDLKRNDEAPPPGWLCVKCERFGLRGSSYSDPLQERDRNEALERKETLLLQRAKLERFKAELLLEKSESYSNLKELKQENSFLLKRKRKTLKAVEKLQKFTSSLKIYPEQCPEHLNPEQCPEQRFTNCSEHLSSEHLKLEKKPRPKKKSRSLNNNCAKSNLPLLQRETNLM